MSATMGMNMTLTNVTHGTAEARNTTVQAVDRRRHAAAVLVMSPEFKV